MKTDFKRIYNMTLSSVYPHYVQKVERKLQDIAKIPIIFSWLTGYSSQQLKTILNEKWTFEVIFQNAPKMNANVHLITGSICGYKVQEIEDPILQKIRFLDKLIDELAKGKSIDKILRQ